MSSFFHVYYNVHVVREEYLYCSLGVTESIEVRMYGRSIALPVVASSDKQRLLCSQKMSAGKLSYFPSYRQRDSKVKIPAYTFIPLQSCATLLWILPISFLDFFAFCHCSHCGRLPLTLQKGCIKQRKQLLLPLISTSFNLPQTAFPLLFAMHVGKHFLSSFSTTIPTNQKTLIYIYTISVEIRKTNQVDSICLWASCIQLGLPRKYSLSMPSTVVPINCKQKIAVASASQ